MNNLTLPLIARSHLLRRLQAALKTGHVFISAPPGYGKTTLLRLLAIQHPGSAYITLDLADADSTQLQVHLKPALRPGATLLLDDAQILQGASEALVWLVGHARSAPARLVLSGRQIPLSAEALGTAATVTVFSEDDLAFTQNESEAMLKVAGAAADSYVAGWHKRTRGWPLAVALLAGQSESLPRLQPAGGRGELPGELFEYLAETLIQELPSALQYFMALTAVPLRFDDELAAALLGGTAAEAAQLRAQVLARNLFLSEANPAGWFRYHDLIREFMLAHLERFGEDRGARLGQVAEWFAALLIAGLGAPLPAAVAQAPATSAAVPQAPGATILVNGTACTLANAIKASNTKAPASGCPAGSGADVLSLAAGATFTLTVADNADDDGNGLPIISSTVTIDGNGATVARDPNAAGFRLLDVSSAGALTVNNLTLRGGNLFGAGGALLAHSFVTLTNLSLTSNGAVFGGAVDLNAGGWISAARS